MEQEADQFGLSNGSAAAVLEELRKPVVLPAQRFGADRTTPVLSRSSLLKSGEPWDQIDVDRLPIVPEVQEWQEPQTGYRLRPYWLTGSPLLYHWSSAMRRSGETELRIEADVSHKLVKCQAGFYIWSEASERYMVIENTWAPLGPPITSQMFYDQCAQTLRRRAVGKGEQPEPVDVREAAAAAIHSLPLLYPLGCIRMGATWSHRAGDNEMNFTLRREMTVGGMQVLLIEREGVITHTQSCLTLSGPELVTVRVRRRGLMLFACNSGVILEDRVHESTAAAEATSSLAKKLEGTETATVARLALPVVSTPASSNS